MTYPDASFLVSLYIDEQKSSVAHRFMSRATQGLAYTPFHRLEVRSALRACCYRKEISRDVMIGAFRQIDSDLAGKILVHTALVWADALREAERLGDAFGEQTGVRAGDLLHVASVSVLGFRDFLTFDKRQAKLAILAGLRAKVL